MVSLDFGVWVRLFIWLAIGLVIYFVYGQASAARKRQKGL
jgi:hypothetical protein